MSYIFDALKKSEQERNSQQALGLDAVRIENSSLRPSKPKPIWIWLIPLLLGLNILQLLWPSQQVTQEIKAVPSGNNISIIKQPVESDSHQSVIKSSNQDHQPAEVASAIEVTALSPSEQASLAAESVNYHRDPFAPLQPDNKEVFRVTETPTTPTAKPPVTREKRPVRTLPSPNLALLNQRLINQALIEKQVHFHKEQSLPTDSPPLSTRPIADSLAIQTQQTPMFQELSKEQRKEIAPLKISVHIYTTKAADRMARINGQMVHEGHSLSAQLRLLEITPNALIFSHKDQRFQIKR